MSITIPEHFFVTPYDLMVIHSADYWRIQTACMSLYALMDMAGDSTPSECRVSIDREQLAYLLQIVAEKLDKIPEVSYVHVSQSKERFQYQGVQL